MSLLFHMQHVITLACYNVMHVCLTRTPTPPPTPSRSVVRLVVTATTVKPTCKYYRIRAQPGYGVCGEGILQSQRLNQGGPCPAGPRHPQRLWIDPGHTYVNK